MRRKKENMDLNTLGSTHYRVSPIGIGLAALAQPWADVVLSGAATIEHLESNLRAVEVMWDDKAASELYELAETQETYWKIRSGLGWN